VNEVNPKSLHSVFLPGNVEVPFHIFSFEMDDIKELVTKTLDEGLPGGITEVESRSGLSQFKALLDPKLWKPVEETFYSSKKGDGLLSDLHSVSDDAYAEFTDLWKTCQGSNDPNIASTMNNIFS
jgi:hypothetical protein